MLCIAKGSLGKAQCCVDWFNKNPSIDQGNIHVVMGYGKLPPNHQPVRSAFTFLANTNLGGKDEMD